MKEIVTVAEPFPCKIVLRLFYKIIYKLEHVPLIWFEITFLVVGISKDGIGGESIITEGSILRSLEGVDREGELVGSASVRLIFIPLDVSGDPLNSIPQLCNAVRHV
jgi:hypothetical protein